MFAGVVSRDGGEPWPDQGMTSELWWRQPVGEFMIDELVATQPGILFAALNEGTVPYGGDPLPHVVRWQGVSYLEDGHHRVVRAALAGQRTVVARYLEAR